MKKKIVKVYSNRHWLFKSTMSPVYCKLAHQLLHRLGPHSLKLTLQCSLVENIEFCTLTTIHPGQPIDVVTCASTQHVTTHHAHGFIHYIRNVSTKQGLYRLSCGWTVLLFYTLGKISLCLRKQRTPIYSSPHTCTHQTGQKQVKAFEANVGLLGKKKKKAAMLLYMVYD